MTEKMELGLSRETETDSAEQTDRGSEVELPWSIMLRSKHTLSKKKTRQYNLKQLRALLTSDEVERDTQRVQELLLLKDVLYGVGVEDGSFVLNRCVEEFSKIPEQLDEYGKTHPVLQTAELVWICMLRTALYHTSLVDLCDVITRRLTFRDKNKKKTEDSWDHYFFCVRAILHAFPCFERTGCSLGTNNPTAISDILLKSSPEFAQMHELWTLNPDYVPAFFSGQYAVPNTMSLVPAEAEDPLQEMASSGEITIGYLRNGTERNVRKGVARKQKEVVDLFKIMITASTLFIKQSDFAIPVPEDGLSPVVSTPAPDDGEVAVTLTRPEKRNVRRKRGVDNLKGYELNEEETSETKPGIKRACVIFALKKPEAEDPGENLNDSVLEAV